MVQPVSTEGYDGREEAATLSLRRRMGNPANCALFQSACLSSSLLSWIGARRRTIGGRDLERKRPVQARGKVREMRLYELRLRVSVYRRVCSVQSVPNRKLSRTRTSLHRYS